MGINYVNVDLHAAVPCYLTSAANATLATVLGCTANSIPWRDAQCTPDGTESYTTTLSPYNAAGCCQCTGYFTPKYPPSQYLQMGELDGFYQGYAIAVLGVCAVWAVLLLLLAVLQRHGRRPFGPSALFRTTTNGATKFRRAKAQIALWTFLTWSFVAMSLFFVVVSVLVNSFILNGFAFVQYFCFAFSTVSVFMHALGGCVWLAAGSIQLIPSLRQARPDLHIIIGYVALAGGAVCIVGGYMLAIGPHEHGFAGSVHLFTFVSYMLWCLCLGIYNMRCKRVLDHQIWMTRGVLIAFFGCILARAMRVLFWYAGPALGGAMPGEEIPLVFAGIWTILFTEMVLWLKLRVGLYALASPGSRSSPIAFWQPAFFGRCPFSGVLSPIKAVGASADGADLVVSSGKLNQQQSSHLGGSSARDDDICSTPASSHCSLKQCPASGVNKSGTPCVSIIALADLSAAHKSVTGMPTSADAAQAAAPATPRHDESAADWAAGGGSSSSISAGRSDARPPAIGDADRGGSLLLTELQLSLTLRLKARRTVGPDTDLFYLTLPSPHMTLALPIGADVQLWAPRGWLRNFGASGAAATDDDAEAARPAGVPLGCPAIVGRRDDAYVIRTYSPVVLPAAVAKDDPLYTQDTLLLLVRRVAGGAMSGPLHLMQPGDAVWAQGPSGGLRYTPGRFKRVGLVAAGSGLSGVMQVLTAELDTPAAPSLVTLLVLARKERDVLMPDQLRTMALAYPRHRFRLVVLLSGGIVPPAVLPTVPLAVGSDVEGSAAVKKPAGGMAEWAELRAGRVALPVLKELFGVGGFDAFLGVCGPVPVNTLVTNLAMREMGYPLGYVWGFGTSDR